MARYQHIVTLTESEEKELQELRDKGISVVEVFRAGLRVEVAKEN